MRFLLKPVPYFGLFLGLCSLITAGSLSTQDSGTSPTEMSIAELERTSPDDLPQWIRVNDGVPHWEEAKTIYREADGKRRNLKLLLPLVSTQTLGSWPHPASEVRTGFLVEFAWDDLQDQFPEIARAASATEDENVSLELGSVPSSFPVVFEPISADTAYAVLCEPEKQAAKEMKDMGIAHVAVIRPGSKPVTAEDAPGMAVMGLLFTLGSGYWIHRRRKRAAAENIIGGLAEIAAQRFRSSTAQATQSEIEAGVQQALEKHRLG